MKQVELVRDDMRFPALMKGTGEPVLLLHGFPDTYLNWEDMIEELANAGFCAVAPALRGYSPECLSKEGDYSLKAAVDDALSFAHQLGGRVHIVGHDWGAVVAYLAAAREPETFISCTALAIPPLKHLGSAVMKVPEQLMLSSYMQFFQLPLVPEWILRQADLAGVEWLWRRWSPDWHPGVFLEAAKDTLAQVGVLRAALGWYRHLPKFWTEAHREARSWLMLPVNVPTLVLVGKKDGCMSPRLLGHTTHDRDFPAGLEVKQVAGAGHFLHLERPERVFECLLEHLRLCTAEESLEAMS